MDTYRVELHTGRRAIHTEQRAFRDVTDTLEIAAAFDAITGRLGIPADGLTLRVYTLGRRPRLVHEVTR